MGELKLETFEGIEGYWLRNSVAEAFVSPQPHPRVVAFRRLGSQSPFLVTTANQFYGIRTWFLEPTQVVNSPLPALQPAKAQSTGARSLRMVANEEPATELQVMMEISLDETKPVLRVRHGLKNLRSEPRTLAAWAINVLPHRGVAVTPLAKDPTIFRNYILFAGVDFSDPSLRLGKNAIGTDYRMATKAGWVKTGTNTDAGWVAYAWDGQALKSSVAYESGANYPEGGGTITIFQLGKNADEGFCEIENVGPLKNLPAKETLWLDQTLELLADVNIQGDDVDLWVQAIEQGKL
jgi:hypothetical protein